MCIQEKSTAAIKVIGLYFLISGCLGLVGVTAELFRAQFFRPAHAPAEIPILVFVQLSPLLRPILALAAAFLCIRKTEAVLRMIGLRSDSPLYRQT